eukprot:303615-Chlamydomonas_euryale.AAC.1
MRSVRRVATAPSGRIRVSRAAWRRPPGVAPPTAWRRKVRVNVHTVVLTDPAAAAAPAAARAVGIGAPRR